MIKIRKYLRAGSLAEAYTANQKKSARIVGGMLWLKMGRNTIQTAIDITDVVSHEIMEYEDSFIIGGMTSLHDIEMHEGLNYYTQGAMRESLRHIVGIQFRNMATVGGSIYGRYGFSDVLTMFLAVDSYVELYKGGLVHLKDYINQPKDNDIIVNVIVKKRMRQVAYQSARNSATDFPVLTCAVAFRKNTVKAVIGARPQRAMIIEANEKCLTLLARDKEAFVKAFAAQVQEDVITGSNMRASAAYRRRLAGVLTERACRQIIERGGDRYADQDVD